MQFSQKLKILIDKNKLSNYKLSKELSLSPSTIANWLNGATRPNSIYINQLADYFGVTFECLYNDDIDKIVYIIKGNENIKDGTTRDGKGFFFFFFFDENSKFVNKIKMRMNDLDISEDEFIEKTGFDFNNSLSMDNLIAISNILNVSIDYLLGISNSITPLNELHSKVIEVFDSLNEDNQDIIMGKMKELLKEQKYEETVAAGNLKEAK